MIGLEAGGEAAGETEGVAESGDDPAFCWRPRMRSWLRMILETAASHLGGEAGGELGEVVGGGFVGEEVFAELADGEILDGGEGGFVVGVEMRAETSSSSWGIGGVEEGLQGEIGEEGLGGDALAVDSAAMPASWSPERRGVALARRSVRVGKA